MIALTFREGFLNLSTILGWNGHVDEDGVSKRFIITSTHHNQVVSHEKYSTRQRVSIRNHRNRRLYEYFFNYLYLTVNNLCQTITKPLSTSTLVAEEHL